MQRVSYLRYSQPAIRRHEEGSPPCVLETSAISSHVIGISVIWTRELGAKDVDDEARSCKKHGAKHVAEVLPASCMPSLRGAKAS